MANTGKYVSTAKQIEHHAEKLAALMAIKPSVKAIYLFEVGDAAALLSVDPKTLQRKRKERDGILAKGEEPDPLDISSIAYVPPRPTVKYLAQDLEDFLRRLAEAAKAPYSAKPKMPGKPAALAVLGFQSWLASASLVDTWSFSIQPDGRPMDLCAAILIGKLTGKAEDLTPREFGDRVADAASRAFHEAESQALAGVSVLENKVRPRQRQGVLVGIKRALNA